MDNFYFEMWYRVNQEIDPSNYSLSIGTIRLDIPEELNLDFAVTEGRAENQNDGTCIIHGYAYDFENETYQHEYDLMGLDINSLDYKFFSTRLDKIQVAEVYTEFYSVNTTTENFLPLKLESFKIIFPFDEKTLDLTENISDECQKALKGEE